jgi:hypothetical protein
MQAMTSARVRLEGFVGFVSVAGITSVVLGATFQIAKNS